MAEYDGWTMVKEYYSQEEAAIDCGMLRSNGIECVLNGTTLSSVYPMTTTWAPITMLVPSAQLNEAIRLLDKK